MPRSENLRRDCVTDPKNPGHKSEDRLKSIKHVDHPQQFYDKTNKETGGYTLQVITEFWRLEG